MAKISVCPWWLGYFLINPLRRFLHNPAEIIAPYIKEGMTVVEPGPGMGFFTLELANKVGPSGHVIAIDIQPKMIASLKQRAERSHLMERIDIRLALPESMGLVKLAGTVDFIFTFAVVHELPDINSFFLEAAKALKPNALLLLVEPTGHVNADQFSAELVIASQHGLEVIDTPAIRRSHSALLKKHHNPVS
ncbi:MAG: Methyltransferase type 11 [Firmicutes bacterium]|nr:Methyltransferase type 11 [Bacillota bacterium]